MDGAPDDGVVVDDVPVLADEPDEPDEPDPDEPELGVPDEESEEAPDAPEVEPLDPPAVAGAEDEPDDRESVR